MAYHPKGKRYSGRKTKKGFKGTQYHAMPRVERREATIDEPEEDASTLQSVSMRKIETGYTSGCTRGSSTVLLRQRDDFTSSFVPPKTPAGEPDSSEGGELKGNRIISCVCLVRLLGMVRHCPKIPLSVSEDRVVRGLVTKIVVKCGCGWSECLSNPYSSDELSLNTRSVLGMRMIGKAEESLHVLASILDLPVGMKSISYNRHATKICQGSNGYVRTDQLASASELRAMSAAGKLFVPPPVETTEAPEAQAPVAEAPMVEGEEDDTEGNGVEDSDQNSSDESESEADSDDSEGGSESEGANTDSDTEGLVAGQDTEGQGAGQGATHDNTMIQRARVLKRARARART